MFDTVTATRYIRFIGTGRTKPALMECEREDGTLVEAIVKCSSGMMEGTRALANEAICGMLARDLGLPIPEFFAVQVPRDFVAVVGDADQQQAFSNSDPVAFGSRALPGGFAVWGRDQSVPESLCDIAAEVFTFDAIVVNADRRPENPNCLFSGAEIAIIDHELCFTIELFWIAPWLPDGFKTRAASEAHIFAKPRLSRCPVELPRFEAAWKSITPERLNEYFHALPPSWALPEDEQDRIKRLLLDAQANIGDIVRQSLGVLR